MNPQRKQVLLLLAAISALFIIRCSNKKEGSAYGELFSQSTYAPLTDSIKKFPQHDELYFHRAILLNRNNYPEPALADFEKAWSIKKNEEYALGIGTLLLEKNPDSAVAFLHGAIQLIPNSILLKLTLMRGLQATEKTDQALQLADSILVIDPAEVSVLKMKASLLEKKGDTVSSVQILQSAYTLAPYDPELNYVLALRYAEAKNPKVLKLCDSLIKADTLKEHAEPYYYKGIYFSNIHSDAEALNQFELAIQHDYNFLDAYIEKGSLFYDEKKFPEAMKVFQLANRISPTFADAYYWMAKCQEAMGQKDEAKLNYLRAYSLDKTIIEAKEAADRLK
jgi:tetratricopeptide (TPR) repeat protein